MSTPIPLTAVATAGSFESHDVQELAGLVGLPAEEREALTRNGLDRVPVATEEAPELVDEVLAALAGGGWRPADCATALLVHSLDLEQPELDRLDRLLRARLPGLRRPPLLLTGRPCAVVHHGIELAAGLCGDGTQAVVLGVDVAAKHEERFFFGSAMGDAAAGIALGGAPALGHLLAARSDTRIIATDGEDSPPAAIARFRAQNPTAIRAVITGTLHAAGLTWTDLAAIVPHTPNRLIWDAVAALCGFDRERILDLDIASTGHLNSNDVLVHLASAVRAGRVAHGDVVALVSPGFGGTRGCTVIRYGGKEGDR